MLEKYLYEEYDKDIVKKILEGYSKRKTTFRINTLHNNNKALEELNKYDIKYKKVSWYDSAYIIIEGEDKLRDLEAYKNGDIYLQSLSSMLPPLVLEPNNDDLILDMTAAPGSKTSQIAALSNNLAMITAVEKNKKRIERMKYNLDKLGVKKCNVIQSDARHLDDYYSFDKILLDAPCSGSGTLSNIKEFDNDLLERINKIQKELIDKAITLLAPKGELVYSTCSILKQENEDVINYILNKNDNLELIEISKDKYHDIELLPNTIDKALKVMPNKYYEGFFVCKLRKTK